MSLKQFVGIACLAMLSFADARLPVAAQSPPHPPPGSRPRIEVNPRPPLYRRCTGWYELQYRPSGTVLYPAKHCWWVRG
ncbi:MAG TPA: hypothetical protein VEJ37_03115 [Xanthobacteraceae bacterium]|nr:hypothetical protein [Xanthobacteraceae bacterium]